MSVYAKTPQSDRIISGYLKNLSLRGIMDKLKGITATVSSAILYGLTPIIVFQSFNFGSNPETTVFYRNLFVLPIILLIMLIKKVDIRVSLSEFCKISLVGAMGPGITSLLLFSAYKHIDTGSASAIHFLYPIMVALLAILIFKDHFGPLKVISIISAGAGILFFLSQGQALNIVGIILAAASSLTYALYFIGVEKLRLTEMNPYKVSFYLSISVVMILLIYNIPTRKLNFTLEPPAYLYIFILSLSAALLAVVLLQTGIKYLGYTTAAIFSLFEPLTSIFTGAVFLKETVTPTKIIGCMLILTSVVILSLKRKSTDNRKEIES